jgi:hypothetical protein
MFLDVSSSEHWVERDPILAGERKQRLHRNAKGLGLISDRNIWVRKLKSERP